MRREALHEGYKQIVRLILAEDPPLEAKDDEGITPLQYADKNGHPEVAELLRKNGAKDVEAEQ